MAVQRVVEDKPRLFASEPILLRQAQSPAQYRAAFIRRTNHGATTGRLGRDVVPERPHVRAVERVHEYDRVVHLTESRRPDAERDLLRVRDRLDLCDPVGTDATGNAHGLHTTVEHARAD